MARSTSDGGRRTPYSFPESSSDPNSVIRRSSLSVRAFLLTGSWLGLLVYLRGGVWDTQPYSHCDAWWCFLPHLKQRLFSFLLSIWSCGTKSRLSPLFFFLSSGPALSCNLSSKVRFFPRSLLSSWRGFLCLRWNPVVMMSIRTSCFLHASGFSRRCSWYAILWWRGLVSLLIMILIIALSGILA